MRAELGYRVMGIVNVTPDSFSDGGSYEEADAAIAHGLQLIAEGAAVLDIGGESTRPGAPAVDAGEELRRVVPVIEALREPAAAHGVQISIDTSKAEVARQAIAAGATLVNDVTALHGDPEMAALCAGAGVDVCLMHMRGSPRTMQDNPRYDDVVDDVKRFLEERVAFATGHGIAPERIILDPGIGFGKTVEHNLTLLRRLPELSSLGCPILIGTSRKSFIGKLTGRDTAGRLAGTLATSLLAYERGATILRVHEVAPLIDALTVTAAVLGSTDDDGR